MKTTSILVTVLAAALVTPALAGPGGKRKPIKAEVLQKFDANGDGQLDREERTAMRQARKAAMLAKYDADGDGTLSEAERQVVHTERVIERFEKLDTNSDGVLSFEEFEAGAKMHKGKGFMHGKRHMRRGKGKRDGKGKGKRGGSWNKPKADTAE